MPPTQSNTIIGYTVTGLNQIQSAIPIIQALSNANNLLARSLNTVSRAATKAAPALLNYVTVFNQLNPAMATAGANNATLATAINNTATAIHNATTKTQTFLISWQSVLRIMMGSAISRALGMIIRSFEGGMESAMEFQKRISEIRTVGQDSINTFNYWADSVRGLSDAFAMPLLDVAEAQYQTLSNQVGQGAEAVRFMDESLRFATITVSSAADAVDLLSGIMNAYGMNVNEAREISDQFFRAIELGRFRAEDVANSIGRLAVLGAQVGVGMDELNAALSTLSVQGISPEQSMTALRNVLVKLAKPTEGMAALFKELGITSGEAAIRTFGFSGVLEILARKAEKSNEPLSELAQIFKDIRPTIGAAGLANAFDKYDEFLNKIRDSAKNADEALKFMRETPRYEIAKELQKISNFFVVDVGQKLLTIIANFSKEIAKLSDVVKTLSGNILTLGKAFIIGLSFAIINKFTVSMLSAATALRAYIYALGMARTATLGFMTTISATGFGVIAGLTFLVADAVARSQRRLGESLNESFKGLREATKEALNNSLAEYNKWADKSLEVWTKAIRRQEAELNRFVAQIQKHITYIKDTAELQLEMQKAILSTQEKLLNGPQLFKAYMDQYAKFRDLEKAAMAAGNFKEAKDYLSEIEDIIERISKMKGITIPIQTGRPKEMRGGDYTNQGVNAEAYAGQLRKQLLADQEELNKKIGKGVDYTRAAAQINEKAPDLLREQLNVYQELLNLQKQYNDQRQANNKESEAAIFGAKQYVDDLYKQLKGLPDAGKWANLFFPHIPPEDKAQLDAAYDKLKLVRDLLSKPGAEVTPELVKQIGALSTLIDDLAAKGYRVATGALEGISGQLNAFKNVLDAALIKQKETKALSDEIERLGKAMPDITKNIDGVLKSVVASWDLIDKLGPTVTGNIDIAAVRTQSLVNAIKSLTDELTRLNEVSKDAMSQSRAATQGMIQPTDQWTGGYINRFAGGGIASDQIPAYLSRGEVVMNQMASKRYLPDLLAMNSRTSTGSSVTNVGDINISVQGGNTSDITLRQIGEGLRRELKRKTLRLN